MAINYDKKLNNEINRVVKNFNQKITRLEKQNRELLPSKTTTKEIKNSITTKRELNQKLRELKQFSQKGIENVITTRGGVTTTKYELQKLRSIQAKLKKRTYRQIQHLQTTNPKVLGKEQPLSFAQMGDSFYNKLLGRKEKLGKNISNLSPEEFEKYQSFLNRYNFELSGKQQIFMENYFDMLSDLAYYVGYDEGKIEQLKDKLMQLPPNKFYEFFNDDQGVKSILYYYVDQTKLRIDPEYIKEDVTQLYDDLIDNIDEILKSYKNA